MIRKLTLDLSLFLVLAAQVALSFAQGTNAFTYQGRLMDSGLPANGGFDFRAQLYNHAAAGEPGDTQSGPTLTLTNVTVSNGLFTVTLDPGAGVFTGAERWLEVAVRTNGALSFTALQPRQKLTSAPYAITARQLSGPLPSVQLSGTLAPGVLPTGGNWALNTTLTLDSSTLAVDPVNDRVGIGTASPSSALTVQSVTAPYGIEHTDGDRRLSTYLDGNGCWFGSVSPHPLHFFVNNGGSSLTIDTLGRIGLGTSSPVYPLHLVGGLGGVRIDSTSNPNGSVLELRNTLASPNYLGAINFNDAAGTFPGQLGYLASHDLTLRTAGAERVRVDNAGRVGIGTTSPQESLHVNGNVRVDGAVTVSEITRFLSVPPAEWTAVWEGGDSDTVLLQHLYGGFFARKWSGLPRMVAPIQLPHGAKIIAMTARVFDVSPDLNIEIQLRRNSLLTDQLETIATMSTTDPDTPGTTLISTTAPFSHTVNNQFNSYDLLAIADWNTGVGTLVIRYTVTSPLP